MKKIAIVTSDGLYLNGRMFPAKNNTETIIAHIPGMCGNIYSSKYYSIMADYFPQNGITYLATESRAELNKFHGENYSEETFEDSYYDIDAWINKVVEIGFKDIWIQAASLGPSKVVHWYFNKQPKNINGLIFLSPSDMLGLVHDKEGIKDHKIMLPIAKSLVSSNKENELIDHLLWGVKRLTARSYISYFDDNSEAAIFNYANPNLNWKKVNYINIPVFAVTGTKDDGICAVIDPYKAMQILEEELINCPRKKTIVYVGADHDFVGFEEKISQEILKFINQK